MCDPTIEKGLLNWLVDESGGACACGMGICDVAVAVALQKGERKETSKNKHHTTSHCPPNGPQTYVSTIFIFNKSSFFSNNTLPLLILSFSI